MCAFGKIWSALHGLTKDKLIKLRRWLRWHRLVKQTRAVIIDDGAAFEAPIFLIGCRHSGTSLVR